MTNTRLIVDAYKTGGEAMNNYSAIFRMIKGISNAYRKGYADSISGNYSGSALPRPYPKSSLYTGAYLAGFYDGENGTYV